MIDLSRAGWFKSSHSGENGGCVEVATGLSSLVAVRDSTDPTGPTLVFSPSAWTTFTDRLKIGELHPNA